MYQSPKLPKYRGSQIAISNAKKPVVNQDLWMELEQAADGHDIQWTWTKGHANHEDNNRCDELATQAAREQA